MTTHSNKPIAVAAMQPNQETLNRERRKLLVPIPAAVTAFPGESYVAPRSWVEKAYPKLIYFHQAEAGGHFAAWEQPEIFSREVRDAFRPLRGSI